jgi:GTPase SAR1 family protein
MLKERGSEGVGPATVFISHVWRYRFVDIMSALESHFRDEPDTCIWLDLFSNNQHVAENRPFEWWTTTFKSAIAEFGRVVMVLSPWYEPIPFLRAWCWHELYCGYSTNCKVEVIMPQSELQSMIEAVIHDPSSYANMLANIDFLRSDCFNPDDKDLIFETVKSTIDIQVLNEFTRSKIRDYTCEGLDHNVFEGNLILEKKNNEKALQCYKNCWVGYANLGIDYSKYSSLSKKIALVSTSLGRYEESIEYYQKDLYYTIDTLGDKHRYVAEIYKSMGSVYTLMGKFDEAEVCFKQNREIIHGSNIRVGIDEIDEFVKAGSKEWRRSKILIVGEGRAGKTAFSNSVVGKPFKNTESTIGINSFTCDVKYTSLGNGTWTQCDAPVKEFELGVAEGLAHQSTEFDSDIVSHMRSQTVKLKSSQSYFNNNQNYTSDMNISRSQHASWSTLQQIQSANTTVVNFHESNSVQVNNISTKPIEISSNINNDLVAKCLTQSLENGKNLIISVFDYGGQAIFNIVHNFFLTKYGVYTVVFNMEMMVSEVAAESEQCMEQIRFWVNSIVAHTFNKSTGNVAPIAFVGTRKDACSDATYHCKINNMLRDAFCLSIIWKSIIYNEGEMDEINFPYCFFPVDNVKGRNDTSLQRLMACLEDVMDKSEYTHKQVPLTWLKTIDELKAQSIYIRLIELNVIAVSCGVPEDEVPYMLSFLHEMGYLMWNQEPLLRDIVILDPIQFFVTPVTLLICKHIRDVTGDPTIHHVDVHRECAKKYYRQWTRFVQSGILDASLLDVLWNAYVDLIPNLILLMTKFGLMIPLRQSANDMHAKQLYLIPTLLPPANSVNLCVLTEQPSCLTCVFAFSLLSESEMLNNNMMTNASLHQLGFLPSGIYERIVGKAISWSQQTSNSFHTEILTRNVIVLYFGTQKFSISYLPYINAFRVDITGSYPLAIHRRLEEMVKSTIQENMESLNYFTLLPVRDLGESVYITLSKMEQLINDSAFFISPVGNISALRLKVDYSMWISGHEMLPFYDVFISYRWGKYDQPLAAMIFDRLTLHTVGAEHRAIRTFFDEKRLQHGLNFQTSFCHALFSAKIVVLIFSIDALTRLEKHDGTCVDNLLLEWLLSLWCIGDCVTSIQRIFLVFIGKRDPISGTISSFFASGVLDRLPQVIPVATISAAKMLLRDSNISLSRNMEDDATVKDIITTLSRFKGLQGDNLRDNEIGYDCVDIICKIVHDVDTVSYMHSTGTSIDMAFAILQDSFNVIDQHQLHTLLDELGIRKTEHLADCDDEDKEKISNCLKKAPKKEFLKIIESLKKT